MTAARVLVTTASLGAPLDSSWCPQRSSSQYEIEFQRITAAEMPLRTQALSPRLQAKVPKMLAWHLYPGFDYYVWLDSTFSIDRPDAIEWIVESCGDSDACFFPHSKRSSIHEELLYIRQRIAEGDGYLRRRYDNEPMEQQVSHYLKDARFEDRCLFECGVFIYSSRLVANPAANPMKEWFYQNCLWSLQDQLSLPYALSLYDAKYNVFQSSIFENGYFRYRPAPSWSWRRRLLGYGWLWRRRSF